jgi:dTDP-4-dehydrorhamnose reductase
MNVAITGCCGLLGAHLAAALSAAHRVVGFDRHPWWGGRAIELHRGDLADDRARDAFIRHAAPDLLIHCAAMVNVDECESRPVEAYHTNATITKLLTQAVPNDCHVVYITTDGIFDGDLPLRTERDLPCPRTVYARSKLHGEWEIQLANRRHLIVRTNFFGWSARTKNTAGEWLFDALRDGRPITLFDDFWFTPIYVVDLVERILALVEGGRAGIVHVTGKERVTKYEFGMQLAAAAGFSTSNVRRGSIKTAALQAPRPHDMSLDSALAERLLQRPLPHCRQGIARFLAHRTQSLEERVRDAPLSSRCVSR